MSARYRALHPSLVALYGDEFEGDYSADEEQDFVNRGLIAVVPRRYRVVGPATVWGRSTGDEWESDMTLGEAALLIDAGHIEPVDTSPPPAPKPTRKRAAKRSQPSKE